MHTILVVEDQKLIRMMICDALEENNFKTIEAEDGMEGLNKVESEPVSLVVTDLVMPNYDGVNFLSLLLSCHPEIQVIAMTSLTQDTDTFKAAAEIIGEERIMNKSNDYSGLVAKVQSLLGES